MVIHTRTFKIVDSQNVVFSIIIHTKLLPHIMVACDLIIVFLIIIQDFYCILITRILIKILEISLSTAHLSTMIILL